MSEKAVQAMNFVPFVTVVLGAAAGFVAGLLSDRFKTAVQQIDAELVRVDAISDEAGDVLTATLRRQSADGSLMKVVRERKRLGQNLTRLLKSRRGWPEVEASIATLANTLRRIQDAADLQDELAALALSEPLESDAANVHRAVTRAAREKYWYRLQRRLWLS